MLLNRYPVDNRKAAFRTSDCGGSHFEMQILSVQKLSLMMLGDASPLERV
jgi:hypothetical protein